MGQSPLAGDLMPKLKTGRLVIQPFTVELVRSAMLGPAAVSKLLGVSVSPGWPIAEMVEALPAFEQMLLSDPQLGQWMGSIILREQNRLIGDMGFLSRPNEQGEAEIGFGLAADYRGQGYAQEAVSALIAWGWMQPELKKITACCEPENRASIRLLKKLGMMCTDAQSRPMRWELLPGR